MKRSVITAVLLFTVLLISGCSQNEEILPCVQSSVRSLYAGRIYEMASMENGFYLTYTEIDDDEQTRYYACPDPVCSHQPGECMAFTNTISEIALVPKEKGCTIYYPRYSINNDGEENLQILAYDMASGKIAKITSIPDYKLSYSFIIGEEYLYYTNNTMTDKNVQAINIFRAPLSGGDLEQLTFAEDIQSGCRAEYYEDGYIYFRRGNTLVRTTDFTSEEVLFENLDLYWDMQFYDGWLYYTDDHETVIYKPDQPISDQYESVYGYSNEKFAEFADSRNSCSIYRVKLDGSGEKEKIIDHVQPGYAIAESKWYVANNTLYCIPCDYELQGTMEFKDRITHKPALSYVWSSTKGTLIAVDLDSMEKKTVFSDIGYDIFSFDSTGSDTLIVTGQVYELDKINAYYETNEILNSDLRFFQQFVLDKAILNGGSN